MSATVDSWSGAVPPPAREVVATETIEWSFNPWRERPRGSWLAIGVTFACVALLFGLGLAPLTSLALGLAVGATLGALILPVRCRIDDDGVGKSGPFGWERRRWQDLRRATVVRGGLLVSPFQEPQPLDRFRALLLPIPAARRAELAERIAVALAQHERACR